ncbi:MAG: sigma-70 family RNA polymerase sigma factor [Pedobacter sp.]|uniref:RNA polymerase sigma factor n=1 Tax=Pedobacter sp. TaxID=1411316 RepID=UPI003392CC05
MQLLSDESDEVLFDLLKVNNEKAFAILYNRYWDKLLEVAYFKLKSQVDAEEVLQQLFIQIWDSRHHIFLRYTLRTYISAALKYAIYRKIAERKKQQVVFVEGEINVDFADNSTQYMLDFSQVRNEIETLVAQLPEKCQMVYRLSRQDDMTAKEISERMHISEKTVQGHLTKALKYIKNNLTILF